MSKLLYDERAWEDAGRVFAQLSELPAGMTKSQTGHYIREVLATEIFRRSSKPKDQGRLPQGSVFWMRKMASSPQVTGLVNQCRQAGFGQSDPPFASLAAAVVWLQRQKRSADLAYEEDSKRMRLEEWVEWEDGMPSQPPGMRVSVRTETLWIDFSTDDGRIEILYAHTRQLAAVASGAIRIAEITGWPRVSATSYILSGGLPVNSFAPLVWNTATGVPWIEARLYPASLNAATFQHLLQVARTRMINWLTDIPNGTDAGLLDIMQEIGWPPKGRGQGARVGLTQYWKELAKRWNQIHRKDGVTADALRKRWERMKPDIKKLGERATQHTHTTKGAKHGKTR